MSYDEGLAQRVREVLDGHPNITERRMFGGLAFLVDGKMFVGISSDKLMAWVLWCRAYAANLPAKPPVKRPK